MIGCKGSLVKNIGGKLKELLIINFFIPRHE